MRKRRLKLVIPPHQRIEVGIRNLGRVMGMVQLVMMRTIPVRVTVPSLDLAMK